MWNFAELAAAEVKAEKAVDEVLEPDVFIIVIADGEFLAGGGNGSGRVEAGGIYAQFDIRHKGAEHDQAVAVFDVLAHIVPAHSALVDAEVKRVLLADDRFAEDGGGHGNVRL